jgi:protein phosphatase PTC6
VLLCFDVSVRLELNTYRHGGASVSDYLHNELHSLLEVVEKDSVIDVYRWLKSHGGYFKRFRGGVLQEWVENPQTTSCFDLDARLTLAFLEVRIYIDSQYATNEHL